MRRVILAVALGLTAIFALAAMLTPPTTSRAQESATSAPDIPDTPDTTVPAYLQELRALATEAMARGDSAAGAGAVPAPPGAALSVEDYARFVERAVLDGIIEADSVALTRPVVPRMVVHDRDAIAYLFDCCAFDEETATAIELVEIYDFGRSGFSNGDLMVCQPSGRSYLLEGLDDEFLAAAATWARAEQLEVTRYVRATGRMDELATELAPPDTFEWEIPPPDLPPDEDERAALRAIWAGVHQAVADQYGQAPLELYFARDDSTTGIEVWGYRPDSLSFRYLTAADGPPRNDVLTVTVADTITRASAAYLDVLVISESRVDTVLVPVRGR